MNEHNELDTIKVINIIFAEHEKLSIENPLLKSKVSSLELLNSLYIQSDSLKTKEIEELKNFNIIKDQKIKKLKSSKKKITRGAFLGGIITFIIGVLI